MIWLWIEDPVYFQRLDLLNEQVQSLGVDIPKLDAAQLCMSPSIEEIHVQLKAKHPKVILDYRLPVDILGQKSSVFTIVEIKSPHFPFTYEQKEIGISKERILSERLGLRIVRPSVTLDDMAGAEDLHKDIHKMLNLEEMELMHITGLFLFGVAGSGKSYFAECFAGTTGRYFVMLDLAYFMSLPNPVKAIDDVFFFLLGQKEKYLLLIDEIEKMFQLDNSSSSLISDQVFGKMLTWLSTIYDSQKSNVTFVATANRVENLLKNKPEFVRRGRFDRLYFLNYPKIESSAPQIMEMYLNKEKQKLKNILFGAYDKYCIDQNKVSSKLKSIFVCLEQHHITMTLFIGKIINNDKMDIARMIKVIEGLIGRDKITDAQYFIYSPPEIKSLVKEILQAYVNDITSQMMHEDFVWTETLEHIVLRPIAEVLEEIVFQTPPLQITAPEGIGHQIAQAKKIKQGDRISPFTEIS